MPSEMASNSAISMKVRQNSEPKKRVAVRRITVATITAGTYFTPSGMKT